MTVLRERTQQEMRGLVFALHARTTRIEELTRYIPAWYAGTRARVETRAALEQAEELRRVVEELNERLGEYWPGGRLGSSWPWIRQPVSWWRKIIGG